jgi:hypothetical protein
VAGPTAFKCRTLKVKVRAYLLVDMPKNFAEKFNNLFNSNYCILTNESQSLISLLKRYLVSTLHKHGKVL